MSDEEEFAKSVNEKVIETSNIFIRTLIIIHGGASVALLAFIGGIVGKSSPGISPAIGDLAKSLMWFGWGIVLAMAAMFFAYLTHYLSVAHAYAIDAEKSAHLARGKALVHSLAVIAALLSLGVFLCGMYEVREAILTALK